MQFRRAQDEVISSGQWENMDDCSSLLTPSVVAVVTALLMVVAVWAAPARCPGLSKILLVVVSWTTLGSALLLSASISATAPTAAPDSPLERVVGSLGVTTGLLHCVPWDLLCAQFLPLTQHLASNKAPAIFSYFSTSLSSTLHNLCLLLLKVCKFKECVTTKSL